MGFGVLLCIVPLRKINDESLRSILEHKPIANLNEVPKASNQQAPSFDIIESKLIDAANAINMASRKAVKHNNEILRDELKNNVEVALKKSLDNLLVEKYGEETANKIERKVFSKLESVVSNELKERGDYIAETAKDEMDALIANEVEAKSDNDSVNEDIETIQKYLVEDEQLEVKEEAENILLNIRQDAEKLEKEILAKELNEVFSEKDLEEAELATVVADALMEMKQNEKTQFSKIGEDLLEGVMTKNVSGIIDTFLSAKGKSSKVAAKMIEEVRDRLEAELQKNLKEKSEEIDSENDLAEGIQDAIEQDRYVIDRAFQLGLKAKSPYGSGQNLRAVDIIENDVESSKQYFNEYMTTVAEAIAEDLQKSVNKMMESIQKDVFEANGVDVTSNEIMKLVNEERYAQDVKP